MIEKPITYKDLNKLQDADGRYFKLSYRMMGNVIKETRIFQYKYNLNNFLLRNEALFESSALYLLEDEKKED